MQSLMEYGVDESRENVVPVASPFEYRAQGDTFWTSTTEINDFARLAWWVETYRGTIGRRAIDWGARAFFWPVRRGM